MAALLRWADRRRGQVEERRVLVRGLRELELPRSRHRSERRADLTSRAGLLLGVGGLAVGGLEVGGLAVGGLAVGGLGGRAEARRGAGCFGFLSKAGCAVGRRAASGAVVGLLRLLLDVDSQTRGAVLVGVLVLLVLVVLLLRGVHEADLAKAALPLAVLGDHARQEGRVERHGTTRRAGKGRCRLPRQKRFSGFRNDTKTVDAQRLGNITLFEPV